MTLPDALVAGSSTGYLTVVDGTGGDWSFIGTGDSDGDGKADLLWRKIDGTTALAVNSQLSGSVNTIIGSNWYPIDLSWHPIANADVNGDGKTDVIWRNDNGGVAVWKMNGSQVTGAAIVGSIGNEWQFSTTADFNNDGKSDLLWYQPGNNSLAIWQMNGTQVQSAAAIVGSIGADWHLVGATDVSGDHQADAVWRNDAGAVAVWQMNGTQVQSSAIVGSIGAEWSFSGFGDFNGDGRSDMLWHTAAGGVALWQMNGTQAPAGAIVGSIGADWHVAADRRRQRRRQGRHPVAQR